MFGQNGQTPICRMVRRRQLCERVRPSTRRISARHGVSAFLGLLLYVPGNPGESEDAGQGSRASGSFALSFDPGGAGTAAIPTAVPRIHPLLSPLAGNLRWHERAYLSGKACQLVVQQIAAANYPYREGDVPSCAYPLSVVLFGMQSHVTQIH